MITTGIDIVSVPRIKKVIQTKKAFFLRRVFTAEEQAYCEKRANRYVHFAARFAAKEAFLKACGEKSGALAYKDIEVRKRQRVPVIVIHNRRHAALKQCRNISLSISHEKEFAIAVVIVEWMR